MKPDFKRRAFDEAKKLFPDGVVEPLVRSPTFSGGLPQPPDSAVRLVHKERGIEMTCDEFPSQTENYVIAAIRLRIACDENAA